MAAAGFRRAGPAADQHQQGLPGCAGRLEGNFTIFEGTSEIQHLVIARAISGIHIQ